MFGLDPTIEDADDYGTPVAYTEALYAASKGTPAASLTAYEDAWGWFYSAYSPVFDSTVWLGILDLRTGVVEYVNAGHEYPIVGAGGKSVKVIKNDNCPPLAIVEDKIFTVETLTLEKGDDLFLYTDGVPEAKAADGSRFGMARLVRVLERNENKSPEHIVTELKREVDSFQSANDPFDDVTIMSVVWKDGL